MLKFFYIIHIIIIQYNLSQ